MDEETQQQDEVAPITRRDLFAAAALTGLIANGMDNAADNALSARAYADTMIAVLDGHHDTDGGQ
jgi:hypothetical protein